MTGRFAWLGVAVHFANAGSVPYSNQASAADPSGFTVPIRTALSVEMAEADRVWTAGGDPLPSPDVLHEQDTRETNPAT